MRTHLLLGASAAALILATPAFAQEVDPEATQVDEIVVTGIRQSLA